MKGREFKIRTMHYCQLIASDREGIKTLLAEHVTSKQRGDEYIRGGANKSNAKLWGSWG